MLICRTRVRNLRLYRTQEQMAIMRMVDAERAHLGKLINTKGDEELRKHVQRFKEARKPPTVPLRGGRCTDAIASQGLEFRFCELAAVLEAGGRPNGVVAPGSRHAIDLFLTIGFVAAGALLPETSSR